MIVLTKPQADAVRGVTTPGHAIEPRQIGDDKFILGDEVLADPMHTTKTEKLREGESRKLTKSETTKLAESKE